MERLKDLAESEPSPRPVIVYDVTDPEAVDMETDPVTIIGNLEPGEIPEDDILEAELARNSQFASVDETPEEPFHPPPNGNSPIYEGSPTADDSLSVVTAIECSSNPSCSSQTTPANKPVIDVDNWRPALDVVRRSKFPPC